MTKGVIPLMAFPASSLYSRARTMLPEILKFCIVGGIGTIIDLGGAAVLHSSYHVEPLAAKAVSVTLATMFTYLGSRFWTFKHRENQSMKREAVLFFVLNIVGLAIAEAVIGLVTYVFGLRGAIPYNAASVIGTGFGTIFRFYAYRKWVFLEPEQEQPAPAAGPTAPALADYPLWDLDPSFLTPANAPSSAAWEPAPALSRGPGAAPPAWGAPLAAPVAAPLVAPASWEAAQTVEPVEARPLAPARPAPSQRPATPRSPGRHRKS